MKKYAMRLFGLLLTLALGVEVQVARGNSDALVDFNVDRGNPAYKLYESRCQGCHDQALERVPPRVTLLTMTPEYVVHVLTDGAMKQQAAGLNPDEIRSLAQFVTGKSLGTSIDADPRANLCKTPAPALRFSEGDWNGWGKDLDNSRFQGRPGLSPADIPRLKVKWTFAYPGQATYAPPIVVGKLLFLSSVIGRLFALDAATGCTYWTFDAGAMLKGAPTVARDASTGTSAVYFADERSTAYAVNAATGELLWKTKVDDHPLTQVTGSPLLFAGRLYVPVASQEELGSREASYPCCTFRGSLVALQARTGAIVWKSFTIDEKPGMRPSTTTHPTFGPAGGALWHSALVDPPHHQLFVVTGNSYTDDAAPTVNSLLAIDMRSGSHLWARQVLAGDNWNAGCWTPKNENCPQFKGSDNDFSAAPLLRTLPGGKRILLTAQKTGVLYALNPDDKGRIVWRNAPVADNPAPSQADYSSDGVQYGLAADAEKVYAGRTGKGGVTAFDIRTGKLAWRTPSPNVGCAWGNVGCNSAQASVPTLIPGALFVGAHDGHIRAYSSNTGTILWDYDTAAEPYKAVNGVVATGGTVAGSSQIISQGILYVNSGYLYPHPGNALIAFSVDGH